MARSVRFHFSHAIKHLRRSESALTTVAIRISRATRFRFTLCPWLCNHAVIRRLPIERGSRVLPIDQSHQFQIFLALFHGLVVQARPAHSQQGTLPSHADGRMFRLYPAAPIFRSSSEQASFFFHPFQLHL
jgi:hypothetical protein